MKETRAGLNDQRAQRAAAEKIVAVDTRQRASAAGGEIRGSRCGAVVGRALHAPMT
jgi:hypothetical protein